MQLSSIERRDLAVFFAKRFPDAAVRARLAASLGLATDVAASPSAVAAWDGVLSALEAQERLHALALLAAREDVHDENLQQVCGVLAGDRPGWLARVGGPRRVGVMGTAMAAAALLGVAALNGAEVAPTAHAEGLVQPAPAAAGDLPASPAGSSQRAEATAEAAGAPAREAPPPRPAAAGEGGGASGALPVARPEAAPVQDTVDPAHAHGRCTVAGGGVVGYWYAGRTSPGVQGQTITVESAVRVRGDYPDTHNGFNARAAIRCFLAQGDRVTLSAAPIHVPGDAWWVPLHSGDLVRE